MKHTKNVCFGLITVLLLLLSLPSYSQNWQLGGNPNPPMNTSNNFLGSDGTNNIPIRLGTFGITRMFIQNNTGPTAGFVGIGNNFSTPLSLLNLNGFGNNTGQLFRTDGNQGAFNRWEMFTGTNAGSVTKKGELFVTPGGNTQQGSVTGLGGVINAGANQFHINSHLGDIILCARGVNGFQNFQYSERMRISGYAVAIPNYIAPSVERTRISISNATPITVPLAMLHMGDPWFSFNVGPHRNWMDVGTYYHVDSDGMYVGLKHLGSDKNESIICFGNNPVANANLADRMRFIFTGAPGNGTSSANAGLEFMHFVTSDGTNPRIGIGDFQTQGGNADPNNTLEILPSATSPYWGWGAGNGSSTSGLRLQRLTSASIVVPNSTNGVDATKVMTVDQNGDVVLTTAIGQANADNGCSTNGPSPNAIHLGNSVGNTQAQLLDDREIPLNSHNLIISGQPETFPGKVGIGIVGGINNASPLSLRPTPLTMQVNGSISIFDGTGNTSVFFGEEQHAFNSGVLGE